MISGAFAVDIAADIIIREGKITRNGKIYVKDNKCRAEKGSTPTHSLFSDEIKELKQEQFGHPVSLHTRRDTL